MSKKCELVLAVAGALVLPAMWSANAAEAAVQARQPRTFNSTVTHTGPAGNTITRQSTLTTNGRGGFSATSTWTGPKGDAIATSQRSGSYDPATKTYSGSGTVTGANGKQASFNTTVQGTGTTIQGQAAYNSASGTFNQSRTTTFPNGQTATENRTVAVAAPAQSPSN
jgi:hypothetical protein